MCIGTYYDLINTENYAVCWQYCQRMAIKTVVSHQEGECPECIYYTTDDILKTCVCSHTLKRKTQPNS